ncbi:hypothetical protein [Variovorax sp. RA8]|uniref:hypothetical protein n=1 Tax=Variovorax sp. (strain JCM 16519 / RA8) TaxID=662548 RepID=UPI000AD258CD|nr:hypothetical protein [Variovorax sp. RA8]VTU36483.1 hypothetical protein RA8CHR_05486 [Variovorax sp. RA8]
MSTPDTLGQQARHLTQRLQAKVISIANAGSLAHLHWGQFVVDPKPDAQVGVYGSTCAAIILSLGGRDDAAAVNARANLVAFVGTAAAEVELAHSLKLAMMACALAPRLDQQADNLMLDQLQKLLGRCSNATHLWPAYSVPQQFQHTQFVERPSEVATAVIVLFLVEIIRRLGHASHSGLRGQITAMLKDTAEVLENAYAGNRSVLARHATLVAAAVILVKGGKASKPIRAAFKEAVQQRDFPDRRVFFYDCVRSNGSFGRDYFILPPSLVLPMVALSDAATAGQRALALDIAPALLDQLDDDGLFRGGQDLPSMVEQGLAGISLEAVAKGVLKKSAALHVAKAWLYVLQPSPSGKPTKLVYAFVILLWIATGVVILGRYVPSSLLSIEILNYVYLASTKTPEPISQFLPFLAAALPVSRAAFSHLIGRGGE